MGYDPLVQFLHEEDAVDALKLAVDADFPGTFNIAGDGVLPLSTVLALAGKVALPIPHVVAAPLARALWMAQIFDVPPSFLDFLRYLCVADAARSHAALGFRPQHDIRQIVTEFAGTKLATASAATDAR
jgi:UDP-glucose 4-epimerase